MNHARLLTVFLASGFSCIATEPSPTPSPEIQAFTAGWGKASGSSSRSASRLDGLTSDQLKKTADLDIPVAVAILEKGRVVEGLEDISERIVDVRITNPNSYPIFFRGRQYMENKTIQPRWRSLKEGHWVDAGWDWCGTGVRDWDVEANGNIEVMLYLHPELSQQQILGRFYKTDRPSIQSDCLLYEENNASNITHGPLPVAGDRGR